MKLLAELLRKPTHAYTAAVINIDPVDRGRHKWSSHAGVMRMLLSATQTHMLASCDGVNIYGARCRRAGRHVRQD